MTEEKPKIVLTLDQEHAYLLLYAAGQAVALLNRAESEKDSPKFSQSMLALQGLVTLLIEEVIGGPWHGASYAKTKQVRV